MRAYDDGDLSRHLFRARRGDDDALEALLDLLRPVLLRYARAQLDSDPEAEENARDLAQEGLVRIVGALDRCRAGEDAQILAWALRIMRNLCVDHFRALPPAGTRLSSLLDEILDAEELRWGLGGGAQAAPSRGRQVLYRVLRQALRGLSPAARRLLSLRAEAGLTWSEVGRELGLTRVAAQHRFQRMQRRLRTDTLRRIERLGERDRAAALRFLKLDRR